MKVLMFTPVAKASAIGRMASLVTKSLIALGHKVTVIATEEKGYASKQVHSFKAKVVQWTDSDRVDRLINSADLIVYQIGDNYSFHRGGVEWLYRHPGVVCLHDFYLGHLFWAWAETRRPEASQLLNSLYDPEVARNFFSFSSSEDFIEATADSSPMTEWICELASGVITHSSWGIGRVLASSAGPVSVVPLAYNVLLESPESISFTQEDDRKLRLLTVGHMNPNKRVSSVIEAIAGSRDLTDNIVYRLAGSIQPEEASRLSAQAKESGVDLEILGQVSDDDLVQLFQWADAVSCLRYPTLEAASASAIEAMLFGKPVIVSDDGFYKELPESFTLKVDPDREVPELKQALEKLLSDEGLRQKIGSGAKAWASQTFTPDNYAQRLLELGESVKASRPVVEAVEYYYRLMSAWGWQGDVLDSVHRPLEIFRGSS